MTYTHIAHKNGKSVTCTTAVCGNLSDLISMTGRRRENPNVKHSENWLAPNRFNTNKSTTIRFVMKTMLFIVAGFSTSGMPTYNNPARKTVWLKTYTINILEVKTCPHKDALYLPPQEISNKLSSHPRPNKHFKSTIQRLFPTHMQNDALNDATLIRHVRDQGNRVVLHFSNQCWAKHNGKVLGIHLKPTRTVRAASSLG